MRAVFDRVGSAGRRGRGAAAPLTFLACSWIALTEAACTTDDGKPGSSTLVLELGGDHGSLRAALQSAGVVITPRGATPAGSGGMGRLLGRDRLSPGGGGGDPDEPRPVEPPDQPPDGPQDGPRDGPSPTPPGPAVEPPAYREVELQSGQTISHIASEHLGTMRRAGEILELNGWTEVEARRLPIGTVVKIPPR